MKIFHSHKHGSQCEKNHSGWKSSHVSGVLHFSNCGFLFRPSVCFIQTIWYVHLGIRRIGKNVCGIGWVILTHARNKNNQFVSCVNWICGQNGAHKSSEIPAVKQKIVNKKTVIRTLFVCEFLFNYCIELFVHVKVRSHWTFGYGIEKATKWIEKKINLEHINQIYLIQIDIWKSILKHF